MSPAVTACPDCTQPLILGAKFCASCGHDVSGVWDGDPVLGTTIVEIDGRADSLGQQLMSATLGEYDIYGELGRGGMAAVYLGIDIALNRKVAIKTMLPELTSREDMVARFKREAQTAAGLNHPHIIQIYSVKEAQDLVFFIMKFVEGSSLESAIRESGQVSLAMAQTIMAQVGSALDYAHSRHVIHRDIKPANIMIDENGMAIVTDFGIAKVQEAQMLTVTGAAMGTPHYMSPEHIHNTAVTGKSDQYSLGVLLYEMLTGKHPFDGRTYAELITQHLFDEPPDVREANPQVPESVSHVIKKMMAKAPEARFNDLEEVTQALGTPGSKQEGDLVRTQMVTLAKSGPQKKLRVSVPMSPVPMTKRIDKAKGTTANAVQVKTRRTGVWATAAVLLLGAIGGGGYWAWRQNQAKTQGSEVTQQSQTTLPPAVPTSAPGGAGTSLLDSAAQAKRDDSVRRAGALARQRQIDDSARIARLAAQKVTADSIAAKRRADSLTRHVTDSIKAESRMADSLRREQQQREDSQKAKAAPAVPQTATVKISSKTPGATLFVDGRADGIISALRDVTIPANAGVKLAIMAAGCPTWDTLINIPAGGVSRIGVRPPVESCKKP